MIKSGFDFIAPVYDKLAALIYGKEIWQAQTKFIDDIPTQARILIIGGGTGSILAKMLAQTSPQKIVYLEASAQMLHLARQKAAHLPGADCLEFRLGTEKDILPEEKFEVIISHFFLDLFSPGQLQSLVKILLASLPPGGCWLVADFVKVSGKGIWPAWARLLTKSMYVFFGVLSGISATTLPDWENLLRTHNLVQLKSAYFYQGMIKSVLYQKPAIP